MANSASTRDHFDLEELWPQLARDEEAIGLRVVGDAVEDVDRAFLPVLLCKQAGQVDPAGDLSRLGIDACDAVSLPDIGPDLAVDDLELVEIRDRSRTLINGDGVELRERLRVPDEQAVGAVAHDQPLTISGQAPTFCLIGEGLLELERLAVEDDT